MAEKEKSREQPKVVFQQNDFPSESEMRLAQEAAEQAERDFERAQAKASLRKTAVKILAVVILGVIFAGGITFALRTIQQVKEADNVRKTVQNKLPEIKEPTFVGDSSPSTVPEGFSGNAQISGEAFASENYRVREMSFGGASGVFALEADSGELKVSEVRSIIIPAKDDTQAGVLISWKTNKLSRSTVHYAKDGSAQRLVAEKSFGFSHALLIPELEIGKRYTYAITARDRAGAQASSDNFALFVSAKPESVFDLISQEFNGMFGWAISKNK